MNNKAAYHSAIDHAGDGRVLFDGEELSDLLHALELGVVVAWVKFI